MLAIVAAVVFGLYLLLRLIGTDLGVPELFNFNVMAAIGFLLLSLYLAGVGRGPRTSTGSGSGSRGRGWYGRRPGRG
jgi:hypothetical protein